jgi:hypothetical protein
VLATGDQQASDGTLNYQYRNRFRLDDYVLSAELCRTLRPDLMLTGHWGVREVDDAFLERLAADGRRLAELHRELLPDDVDFGPEGFGARIEPYRSAVETGAPLDHDVTVRNPFARPAEAAVRLVVPAGWEAEPPEQAVGLDPRGEATVRFRARAGAPAVRARVAADLTVADVPFGQQAEALVEVR